jgi:hypothetical protein
MDADQTNPVRSVVAHVGGVRVLETLDEVFEWGKIEEFSSVCEIVCRSTRYVLYVATESSRPVVEWSLRTGPQGELIAAFGPGGAADELRDAVWVAAGEWLSAHWHLAPSLA